MGNSDIASQLLELYDFNISSTTISKITDKVTKDRISWQNRPLESTY